MEQSTMVAPGGNAGGREKEGRGGRRCGKHDNVNTRRRAWDLSSMMQPRRGVFCVTFMKRVNCMG